MDAVRLDILILSEAMFLSFVLFQILMNVSIPRWCVGRMLTVPITTETIRALVGKVIMF